MLDDLFGFRLLSSPSALSAKAGGAGGGGEPTPTASTCSAKVSSVPDETPPGFSSVSAKVGQGTGGEPTPTLSLVSAKVGTFTGGEPVSISPAIRRIT